MFVFKEVEVGIKNIKRFDMLRAKRCHIRDSLSFFICNPLLERQNNIALLPDLHISS